MQPVLIVIKFLIFLQIFELDHSIHTNMRRCTPAMPRKPTKAERQKERERQRQAERLKKKRADSKYLFIENLGKLRETLRHNKHIKRNITHFLEAGQTTYKEVYELSDEIQELTAKLEDFL